MTAAITLPDPAKRLAEITEPGVYPDLSADEYHRHSALSASGARMLLPPSCPALFRHERDNGRPPKRDFDFGHAAHREVLGIGDDLVVVDAPDYRTSAAQDQREQAYADGMVPLLAKEYAVVQAMAEALRSHPWAGALFNPERGGKPEQSLFWTDAETDVQCRARLDWLPSLDRNPRRLVIPDYKTAKAADLVSIGRSLHEYGYARQAAWYLDGVLSLGLAERAAFVFVVQMKTPPYLVTVAEPDALSLAAGRFYNRQARQVFAECTATDRWPGFSDDEVATVSLPPWSQNQYFEESGL